MRKSLKKTVILLLVFFSTNIIFSNDLDSINTKQNKIEDLLNPEVILELKKNKKVINNFTYRDEQNYYLCPKTKIAEASIKEWNEIRNEDPSISVEAIYLVEKNKTLKNQKQKIKQILHSVDKMQGLEYYSFTRKKKEVLYSEAYAIDNLENRNKITIDVTEDIKQLFVFQDDNSFGKYASKVVYNDFGCDNSFVCINQDYVTFALIKVVKPQDLRIFLDVIECENELIIYLTIQVKATSLKILEGIMNQSFMARTDALYDWFCNEYLSN